VPGITVPAPAREAMANAGKDGAQVGKELAIELLEQAGNLLQGAYLMPSFGRYDACVEIVRYLKDRNR